MKSISLKALVLAVALVISSVGASIAVAQPNQSSTGLLNSVVVTTSDQGREGDEPCMDEPVCRGW
ncbi:hypothetical protein [Vibrio sp. ABG19]|uniref:hypothetical protein n=1 Tax=Vibrio sp. ABG19 TaxID=2817385 RepID=UPI00249ED677|nr:hypothetical protein [Vibrio sp. ABG19]WGY45278.1 hypothetical protein J0X00_06190 [Vibrio sp. ABG19]